ncbi:MAG: hypothetical protein AAF679_03715 [Pseudomonadota bacterium]
MFKDVTFSWPRLDQTYRFDQHKKESVPCPPTAQNASYSLSWEVDQEKAKAFRDAMEAHYNACRTRKPDLPEFSGIFGMKEKDGVITVGARKNGVNTDGEVNKPPSVIDLYHDELEDKKIWGGSTGSVRILAHPSTNPQNGLGGISLILNAVQVAEAKYGGDGFEDDFGAPLEKPNQPQQQAGGGPSSPPGGVSDLDDEIPFAPVKLI